MSNSLRNKYTLENAKILGHTLDTEPHFAINVEASDIRDEYHSMNELYDHRMMLFVALLNCCRDVNKVFKSKLHHDGTMFGPEWFIAGIEQDGKCWLSYHLKVDPYWDMMGSYEVERAPEWDGHTSKDVLERLRYV